MSAETNPGRGALPIAFAGLALALLGMPLYGMLVDVPFLRSTGLSALVPMLAGVVLAIVSLSRRAKLTARIVAGVTLLLPVAFAGLFFVAGSLPAPQREAALTQAIDFTLEDEQRRPVTLSDAFRSGPVLLVFYRGFW